MDRKLAVEGLKGGLVVALSASPFAVLFGAVAADNGFSIAEAGLMSATVYAGASQLVGIELFGHQAAPWLIVLSIFAVNFRHVLYSAAIAPMIRRFSWLEKIITFHLLVDPQFAAMTKRADEGKPVTFEWYLAFGLIIYVPWVLLSMLGAWLGTMMGDPRVWALDVLLPIYFLGIVLGFRRRRNFYPVVAVSALASVIGWYTVGSPWHVSIGAIAGVVVAALLPLPPQEPAR